jgi:hypothetical protein
VSIKGQPNREQQAVLLESLVQDIDRIYDSWATALEARASYGYPPTSPGFAEHGYLRRVKFDSEGNVIPPDPDDLPPAVGDPTGNKAIAGHDRATQWLESVRGTFSLMLRITPAGWGGGATEPPGSRNNVKRAARDLVDCWPVNIAKLFTKLHTLADIAAFEWPPTPGEGAVIGEVKVGGRYVELAECAECKRPITGGTGDPIDKFAGKKYHREPCGNTARKRNARVAK